MIPEAPITFVTKRRQLNLFHSPEYESIPYRKKPDDASFRDPNFANNKTLPIHRWVPWIAGFSSEFVKSALHDYLGKEGTVLDPFAGVGTTLVDAVLSGHHAVGFEINPYAALACRTKISACLSHVALPEAYMQKFMHFALDKADSGYIPKSVIPKGFKTRSHFYSPKVLRKVLIVQDYIDQIPDCGVCDLFKLAFAATMVSYSNYSYEPSLGRRVSAGKDEIHDFPVAETMMDKLQDMAEDIAWIQTRAKNGQPDARVINDSFFRHNDYLKPESVDLVVTSPPYLNNYHYNRNTRPQLYWLGLAQSPHDFKALEDANFGKYWQTVREQEYLDLAVTLPDTDLKETLQSLRERNREKGIYGGNGWANYAAAYFNDCYRFSQGLHAVLKKSGHALVVIGNSILQGMMIHTDQYFGKIAQTAGLELVEIAIPRATRVGNSIIQSGVRVAKAKDTQKLYEAVVVLRKK
jgi:DNA modification methylase